METWGSAATLGVELAPPRCLSSNRRERAARKNLRNVADTDEGDGGCCCQQNSRSELGQKGTGSPENVVSNHLSTVFGDGSGLAPQEERRYEHANGEKRRSGFLHYVNRTGEFRSCVLGSRVALEWQLGSPPGGSCFRSREIRHTPAAALHADGAGESV